MGSSSPHTISCASDVSERAVTLHGSPWQGVVYVTGGGSLLIAELLTAPGASATVLEVRVPYAAAALAELLGRAPEQACSGATARAMAMAAFQRARALSGGSGLPAASSGRAGASRPGGRSHMGDDRSHMGDDRSHMGGDRSHRGDDRSHRGDGRSHMNRSHGPVFGFACTASLATNRAKRGRHRAHVAVQTERATHTAEADFDADRETEERLLLELSWQALGDALGVSLSASAPPAQTSETVAEAAWRSLILGETVAHASHAHDRRLLMPGAFNPLHHAHRRMLTIAEQKTGMAGAYELCVANVDKPLLDYCEIARRLGQFDRPVWLTRLPTFLEKARHFAGPQSAGPHFVVGVDTLVRVVDPRYYGSEEARDAALAELAALGVRFVVFGRTVGDRFISLSDLPLPGTFHHLCIEVPEAEFAEPVSSTALRRGD